MIVGIILLVAIGIAFFVYRVGKVKGNGIIETIETAASEFNCIVLNGSAMIRIYKCHENKISLTIDSNLIKHISLEVKENVLTIETKNCFGIISTEFVVDIYTQNVNDFTINGNGSINLLDNIFNADAYSKISINGSGIFDGKKFKTKNAIIKINGSGKVTIAVEQTLNAEINGSGNLTYYGNPEVKSKINGKGKIDSE
jgi:hypothetical protein